MRGYLLIVVAIAALFLAAQDAKPQAARAPNVLLIITDDQGYGDLGVHGNPHVQTPHIDKLAAESVEMTRFYVSPVCAPTRAALLTGRYSLRTGTWDVTGGRETMHADELTIAELLRDAGYATGCFGKWHNGEHYAHDPNGQGFDEFRGFCGGHWNIYFDAPLEHNNKPVESKGYITDVLTDAAIDFMRRNRDRPFFCYVPFNAPHTPWFAPDDLRRKYQQMGLEEPLATCYAMCESIDLNVGRMLGTLDELKLARNTIVIFMTDNGPNGDRYNAGLRARKGSLHEGGLRVPFFIRYPGKLPEGRKIDTIAAHIDVLPTLAELCDVNMPAQPRLDGLSLVPLLTGGEGGDGGAAWPERALFNHRENRRDAQNPGPGAVKTQRYSLVGSREGEWQLFDLAADPGEKMNVAAEQPQIVADLRRKYDAWWSDVTSGGRSFAYLPIPVGHAQENPVSLPAHYAHLFGKLAYYGGDGYAHDWITNWTGTDEETAAAWIIDVVQPGRYEVSLRYRAEHADRGAKVSVHTGDQIVEGTITQTTDAAPPLVKGRQNIYGATNVPVVDWLTLRLGEVTLPIGRAGFAVQATLIPGKAAMDLKAVELKRLD